MAEKVGIRIGSKFDRTGVDQARKGVRGIAEDAQSSNAKAGKSFTDLMVKVYALVKSIQAVKKVFTSLIDAYGVQDDAERKLFAASKNNPYINGIAAKGLIEYSAQMQKLSRFGDEAILSQQSFLVNLGFTEDQIKDVTLAAVELASTGMVSLESAFRNIAKTFSGLSGELGELLPGLRELTIEERKAGDGVKYILEQFSGMKEASVGGITGFRAQLKNTFGDIKENLGEVFAAVFSTMEGDLKNVFDGIAQWFEENSGKIYGVFINLTAIAKVAFDSMHSMLRAVFDPNNLSDIISSLFATIMAVFATAISNIPDIFDSMIFLLTSSWKNFIADALDDFWKEFKFVFTNLGKVLKSLSKGEGIPERPVDPLEHRIDTSGPLTMGIGFGEQTTEQKQAQLVADFTSTFIDRFSAGFDALKEAMTGSDGLTNAFGIVKDVTEDILATAIEEISTLIGDSEKDFTAFRKGVNDLVSEVPSGGTTGGTTGVGTPPPVVFSQVSIKSLLKGFGEVFSRRREVREAADERGWKDVSDAALNMFSIMEGTHPDLQPESRLPVSFAEESDVAGIARPTAISQMGEVGDLIAGIADPLQYVISTIVGVAMQHEGLQQVMNGLTTVVTAAIDILAGPLTAVLLPVVNLLILLGDSLGKIIAPILGALAPIVEVLVGILSTALVPIFQMVGLVLQPIINLLQILAPLFTAFAVVMEVTTSPMRALGDLLEWLGKAMGAFGEYIVLFITGQWGKLSDVEGPGAFSTDAFSGLEDRIAAIIDKGSTAGTGVVGDLGEVGGGTGIYATDDTGTGTSIYGGNTTVAPAPIINVFLSAEQVNGPGGMEEFGRLAVEAIMEYANIGGEVPAFMEAT